MDERILLMRLKYKSEKALSEVIERYTSYVTTIIREILNDKATAEDIEELVADTFIALWTTAERIDYIHYSSLKAYIGMIARNKAKDFLKTHKNINLELYDDVLVIDDGIEMLMLSWVVMISSCHAVMRLPGYLSWNVPFDGAAVRPITEEISSYIHALPAL